MKELASQSFLLSSAPSTTEKSTLRTAARPKSISKLQRRRHKSINTTNPTGTFHHRLFNLRMFRYLMILMGLFRSSSPESRAPYSYWAMTLQQLQPTSAGAPSRPLASTLLQWREGLPEQLHQRLSVPLPTRFRHRGGARIRVPSFQHKTTMTMLMRSSLHLSWHNDTCQEQQPEEEQQQIPRETPWKLLCNVADSSDILEVCWCCCLLLLSLMCLVNLKSVPPSTARRLQNWDFLAIVLLLQKMSLLALMLLTVVGEADRWRSASTMVTWQSFVSNYMSSLDTHPIITKSVTAGVIAMIGDYFAQWMEFALEDLLFVSSRKAPSNGKRIQKYTFVATRLSIYGRYDLRRGCSLLADGFFISGPLMHLGYEIFERLLPIATEHDIGNAASAALAAVLHVVADTVILDSFFVAFTFISTGLMEGMHPRELWVQFRADYWSSLTASWATSVALCPIQFCFFRYLPLQLRVLSVNCIDLVWGAAQSFMSHRNRHNG